ncbi:MAG: TIGR01777 family protein [Nitrospinae bacterium CG11_big_fil_rev_8_21_14_0_20_45_15]|nr:MAG: TIGR01777 family protein [Nitrospinae bacterium CG11_big_fil_rev_8_21_14_0_20_45_15]
MKVMVTGATGFVGRELIKKLNQKGHEILVLTRNPDTARLKIPVHCTIRAWNPEKESLPVGLLKGVDAIINLAGEGIADGRWSVSRKRKIIESRVLAVRRLVEAMAGTDDRPKVFVSASAIGFYGDRGDEFLDETSAKGEGFLSDVCQDWENEILKAKELGVRTVACRIGMVLGHDGGALAKMLVPFKLGVGGNIASGTQWMSWIHVSDLVNVMIHSIENSAMNGIYNAVNPNWVRNETFTKTLGKILKRPTLLPIPQPVLKLALGELSELLLASQRVKANKLTDTGFQFQYPQLAVALKEVCDHKYHEIELEQWVPQSIEKTFEFFKEAKNLEKLTPEFLKFKVLKQSTKSLEEGTKINYRLSLHGIPIHWQSEIIGWEPNHKFSDVQVKGPYGYWHHTHEFEKKNGGTLIKDRILYQAPFGIAGDLLAGSFIRKDLEAIFNYRCKAVEIELGHA